MRALLVACLILLAACSSTRLVHDRVVGSGTAAPFEHVAVAVIANQPRVRAALENALVEDIRATGSDAFAVHGFIIEVPETLAERKQVLRKLVQQKQADAVLVLSLVGIDTRREFVGARMAPVEVVTGMGAGPGMYWDYGTYYHQHYEYVYVPGYEELHQDYRIDATLFAVGGERPVWQGETSTVDPASIEEGIKGVAGRVSAALDKHQLVGTR